VSTIVLASLVLTASRPSRAAFDVSFLLASGLCLGGACLVAVVPERPASAG
jgi:hypothetical protein